MSNTIKDGIEELMSFAKGESSSLTTELINVGEYIAIGSKVSLNEGISSSLTSDEDKRNIDKYLIVGEEYEVTTKVISGEHTEVYLVDFPGIAFNLELFISV